MDLRQSLSRLLESACFLSCGVLMFPTGCCARWGGRTRALQTTSAIPPPPLFLVVFFTPTLLEYPTFSGVAGRGRLRTTPRLTSTQGSLPDPHRSFRRPFSTLGWPDENAADYRRYFPTAVMETGHDILFFWVARMIMMSFGLTGKAPFHTVLLHGLVRLFYFILVLSLFESPSPWTFVNARAHDLLFFWGAGHGHDERRADGKTAFT